MSFKAALLAFFVATSSLAGVSSAATLTGDEVSITFLPLDIVLGPFEVGDGFDASVGLFKFDLNAGTAGDEFVWEDGLGDYDTAVQTKLSSLDFSGDHVLTGFELFSTTLENLTWTFTADSLLFSYKNPGSGPAVGNKAIYGRFVTAPAAVPVPASLPLLLAGLGGLALLRRRNRISA